VCYQVYCEVSCSGLRCPWSKFIYMKWWADWLADNPRDHARCPGLTVGLAISAEARQPLESKRSARDRMMILTSCELTDFRQDA
jgi:hypothetical protein